MTLLVLDHNNVQAAVASMPLQALLDSQAAVFDKLSFTNNVICPQRVTVPLPAHTALVMPCTVHGLGTAVKVVSVPRGSSLDGLPGTTLVLDELTGAVAAVINATALTAVRTAAGSALATQLVGPPRPTCIAAFGAGLQIEAHISFLLRLYPCVARVSIVNRSRNARLTALLARLSAQFSAVSIFAAEAEQAVRGADIIVCATNSTSPLFKSEWVQRGAHVILVGSYTPVMCEAPPGLMRRAGRIVVDSREACSVEAGELVDVDPPLPTVELGELVRGGSDAVDALRGAGDVTVFKSVGIAAQDVAIALAVLTAARKLELGITLEF